MRAAMKLPGILQFRRSFTVMGRGKGLGDEGLSFPNPCRDFVATKNWVHFTGYDSVKEISFFLDVNALVKLQPRLTETEREILQAFDNARQRIHEVASRVYTNRPNQSFTYHLESTDF